MDRKFWFLNIGKIFLLGAGIEPAGSESSHLFTWLSGSSGRKEIFSYKLKLCICKLSSIRPCRNAKTRGFWISLPLGIHELVSKKKLFVSIFWETFSITPFKNSFKIVEIVLKHIPYSLIQSQRQVLAFFWFTQSISRLRDLWIDIHHDILRNFYIDPDFQGASVLLTQKSKSHYPYNMVLVLLLLMSWIDCHRFGASKPLPSQNSFFNFYIVYIDIGRG